MSDELNEFVSEEVETITPEPEVVETESDVPEVVEDTEKVEEEAEPTAASKQTESDDPRIKAYKATALDERTKRQQKERELAEIKAQLNPEKKPDFWENPEASLNDIQSKVNSQVKSVVNDLSDELARGKFDDYDVVMGEIMELNETNPRAVQDLVSRSTQGLKFGETLYNAYKDQQALTQSGGVSALMAKVAALEAQIAGNGKPVKPVVDVPPDLATARSAGGDTVSTGIAEGNEGLEALLGR